MMSYTKVSYRDGYWQVFVTSVILPVLAGTIITALCVFGIVI